MPRVIAKLASGTSEQQEGKLMEDIAKAVMAHANVPDLWVIWGGARRAEAP